MDKEVLVFLAVVFYIGCVIPLPIPSNPLPENHGQSADVDDVQAVVLNLEHVLTLRLGGELEGRARGNHGPGDELRPLARIDLVLHIDKEMPIGGEGDEARL